MTDTNEEKVGLEPEEDLEELPLEPTEGEEDTTDWKSLAQKNHGIAKRYKTKNAKLLEKPEPIVEKKVEEKQPEKKQDKTEFDLAEETYLLVNGVSKEQLPAYFEENQKTGVDIKTLMNSPYFQESLEKTATANATPSNIKRSGAAATDKVDFWVNSVNTKGEFPPNTPENTELRRKVSAALGKQDKDSKKFADNSIVS